MMYIFQIDDIVIKTHDDCVLIENSIRSISIKNTEIKELFETIERFINKNNRGFYNLIDKIFVEYDNHTKQVCISEKNSKINIDVSQIYSIKEHLRNLGVI